MPGQSRPGVFLSQVLGLALENREFSGRLFFSFGGRATEVFSNRPAACIRYGRGYCWSGQTAVHQFFLEFSPQPTIVESMKTLLVLITLLAAPILSAEVAPPLTLDQGSQDFLRLLEEDDRPSSLQVSIVRFAERSGNAAKPSVSVDLVSAVHVADRSYYQALNQLFTEYDVVLYELVAPEGTKIPSGGPDPEKPKGFASRVQLGMKNMLDLSFQLEEVDYTPANFVHADLSPEQFSASMEQRGESFFQLLFKAWMTALAAPAQMGVVSDAELISALFSSDRTRRLKIIMARQFNDMDQMMKLLDSGEQGSTLITVRNLRALEVLKQEIDDDHKRIAIFYGAGHMADFAQRLMTDFSLVPQSRTWLDAWNLRPE